MAKFTKYIFRETKDYEITKATVDSELYGDVYYTAYASKTSDLFINYMTFTDYYGVKVKALINPLYSIEYNMLMDFIGRDSFTEEDMNNINREVYLVHEFEKEGLVVTPYLGTMAIDKLVVPAIPDGDKAARVRFWVKFVENCFTSAVLDAREKITNKSIQDREGVNHGSQQ